MTTPLPPTVDLCTYAKGFAGPPLATWKHLPPWELVAHAPRIVRELLATLSAADYRIDNEVAVHRGATVEAGAVLKGPLIVGAGCFIAAGAYLRGGCWLDADCIVGPGTELKSSFMFARAKLAHFNFVGDSILGADVNLEAGSIVCNYRNERADKQIRVRVGGALVGTGRQKFGALLGDGCRIGANAVLAPGALLLPGTVVGRAKHYDAESAAGATNG
jgi:UDP-N-acetylglucosamine diphosphorylase / glucose-1-phosphate thymidylyltransferase / UDP-N-acetylgalactosamine diphosphorylase / glucosamine-1-phosphate N-acetyltransferase / galactosamine-1-phosphate N-acetyltransferase